MPACTFTFKRFFVLVLSLSLMTLNVHAAEAPSAPTVPTPAAKKADPGLFDQSTPYLEYGDFSMNDEDDADTLYFQYGRFFGVSLGLGYQSATGNRGLLYQPAFPRFDLNVHYWFDFQMAMTVGIFFASHSYEVSSSVYSVKLMGYGANLKYYFDVRNAAAALSFSNPFITAGAGSVSKTETRSSNVAADLDSTFSVNFGGGLEFPISHKKVYFILDAKYYTQNFNDTTEDQRFTSKGLSDLNGGFFSFMGHLLFTW